MKLVPKDCPAASRRRVKELAKLLVESDDRVSRLDVVGEEETVDEVHLLRTVGRESLAEAFTFSRLVRDPGTPNERNNK